jgi:hypothetical protein
VQNILNQAEEFDIAEAIKMQNSKFLNDSEQACNKRNM